MSSSSDMKNMYQTVKPQFPDYSTRQYARDMATPDPLSVGQDAYNNELAQDRPYHSEATAGEGMLGYNASRKTMPAGATVGTQRQYSNDCGNMGGYGGYGASMSDKGQNPSSEKVSVDTSRADRGKEA